MIDDVTAKESKPEQRVINVGKVQIGNHLPFVWIAGPCQIESREHAMMMARELKGIADKVGVPFIFKASFDKANRTSGKGARGVGIEEGLKILGEIKNELGCVIITDIHEASQAAEAAKVVDILQIPALLCRQTDLLEAAGKTGKVINIKKGQFLAPGKIKYVAEKVAATGNDNILLTERGMTFGPENLVVDMTGLPVMKKTGYPVIMDATHAVQKPGGEGATTGGNREDAVDLANAALGLGVAGLFTEVHNDPDHALSDGPNSLRLDKVEGFLRHWKELDTVAKNWKRS